MHAEDTHSKLGNFSFIFRKWPTSKYNLEYECKDKEKFGKMRLLALTLVKIFV